MLAQFLVITASVLTITLVISLLSGVFAAPKYKGIIAYIAIGCFVLTLLIGGLVTWVLNVPSALRFDIAIVYSLLVIQIFCLFLAGVTVLTGRH